ncbi:MAG: NUDIX hydrolase [Actinomycetia bacterium]|nr:NUDIX hydrolase [Actinomycetes bacterium]
MPEHRLPEPTGFRHISESMMYEGHVWNVVVGTFQSPSGEVFDRDIIRSRGAVGVVPLLYRDGVPTIVFVRQYRPPLDRLVLEIPAGIRDVLDEPTEVTAARELAEEVGLRAARLEYLTNFYSSAGMTDSTLHLYLATDLSAVPAAAHGPEEEHMEMVELPLADAVDMVVRGEIHDAKTVIGLLLVDRRLQQ